MTPLMIFGVFLFLVFTAVYLTKRRFGLLGLALAAGAVLADLWSGAGGLLFDSEGLGGNSVSSENLAIILIVLLPPLFLLLRGPTYSSKLARLGFSVLFMVLALAFMESAIEPLLTGDRFGEVVYTYISGFRELIISGGLAVALAEVMFVKASHKPKAGSKH